MPIMTWTEELSVQIPSIDAQHQKWIDTINALFDAMKAGKAREIQAGLLADVIQFARMHFATEETHMRETGYGELHSHALQHAAFLAKLDDLAARAGKGDYAVGIETMNALKDWVVQHVNSTDKRYGPYLKGHGVA